MAPYTSFDRCNSSSSMSTASNWNPSMLRDIYNGCPPQSDSLPSVQCRFPLIRSTPRPSPTNDICGSSDRDGFKLPPINGMPRRVCNDHPRDDCCRVPTCSPCPPSPPALCVERVPRVKIVHNYEPPSTPFDGCSLYRTQYSGCYGPPATTYKPTNFFDPSTARMSDTSLYREHFTCKPISPVERRKVIDEYEPPATPFDGCSTYRVDFRGCYGRPAELYKPSSIFDGSSGRMDGTTTYRNEFVPYCPAEYQYARGADMKPEPTSHLSCSPFQGCSTYRVDYSPKCVRKQPSMKPEDRYGFSSAPFCTSTTYNNDYPPFYFRECCQDQCIRRCR